VAVRRHISQTRTRRADHGRHSEAIVPGETGCDSAIIFHPSRCAVQKTCHNVTSSADQEDLDGHAGRPSSCQPLSMTTGRRSKVQVAPPSPVLSWENVCSSSDSKVPCPRTAGAPASPLRGRHPRTRGEAPRSPRLNPIARRKSGPVDPCSRRRRGDGCAREARTRRRAVRRESDRRLEGVVPWDWQGTASGADCGLFGFMALLVSFAPWGWWWRPVTGATGAQVQLNDGSPWLALGWSCRQ
jgi:hypothetical protein